MIFLEPEFVQRGSPFRLKIRKDFSELIVIKNVRVKLDELKWKDKTHKSRGP